MSYGDEILAAGRAVRLSTALKRPVVIRDKHDQPRWHPLWKGLEGHIATPSRLQRSLLRGARLPGIVDGPSARPYLTYPILDHTLVYRQEWQVEPGALVLSPREQHRWEVLKRRPTLFVEPCAYTTPNKQWLPERWVETLEALSDLPTIQPLHAYSTGMAEMLATTPTFREACAILANCAVCLTTEGAFMHAARALQIPTIVVWGACTPLAMAYPEHRVLHRGEKCGRWAYCDHCYAAMASITIEEVVTAVREVWGER